MAWVVGIGFGLLLLFVFPKQTIAVVIGLAVVGGLLLYIEQRNNSRYYQAREEERRAIEVTAKVDSRCDDPKFPLFIGVVNRGKKALMKTSFDVKAFRPGYSDPVVSTLLYKSDKIVEPNEGWGTCWSLPSEIPEGLRLQDLVWEVKPWDMTFR